MDLRYFTLSSSLFHSTLTHSGSDGVNDDRRMYQNFLYMRDPNDPSNLNSNHYAFPLPISPVVDAVDLKVSRIDFLPTGLDHSTRPAQPVEIPPANEYTPGHQTLRTDLKPLNVIQPEGASFKIIKAGETGEIVQWQKWEFRIGYNLREGMVIYDVRTVGACSVFGWLTVTGSLRWSESLLSPFFVGYEYPIRRPASSIS